MFAEALSRLMTENDVACSARIHPDDYVEGGLLHCHKCHTPKQVLLEMPALFGGGIKPQGCMCRCETEACEAQKDADRRRQEIYASERLRSGSYIDGKFRQHTFDAFEITPLNERAYRLCQRYASAFSEMEDKNQGLLFYGPVGTGKTFAAACVVNALIDRQVSVIATSFVQLMRQAYAGGEGWFETLSLLRNVRLLVLDDLGAERGTDTALEHVYGVVDDRYRARRPVIFTTNLTLHDLQQPEDVRMARIYDRVLETCYPVEFRGESLRMRQAADRYDEMRAFLEDGV